MKAITYAEAERRCEEIFKSLPKVYSANTPENHPIIFTNDEEFKAGTCILGACVKLFPGIRLYTYQLMSNHLHLVLSGEEAEILEFFAMFKDRLKKYLEGVGRYMSLRDFNLTLHPISDLEYMRNSISYTNRNGSVVNPDCTPFSYQWGANPFYFSPHMKEIAKAVGTPLKGTELRAVLHNKSGDSIKNLLHYKGTALAPSFCDISTGESLFRNARHYFYSLSKNVEAYEAIAKSIGESLYFTDDDLYLITKKLAEERHGVTNLTLLNSDAKINLAITLHKEYNASDKQIQRILKIPSTVLSGLF